MQLDLFFDSTNNFLFTIGAIIFVNLQLGDQCFEEQLFVFGIFKNGGEIDRGTSQEIRRKNHG